MDVVEIKGKELHFVKRVLNRQQYNTHFTIDAFDNERGEVQWGKEFISNLEKKGLLRFENGLMYATDLAIKSIYEKEKQESRLIEENIIEDFEYAFLLFMNNRNEPVNILDFPPNFRYHSKIHGKPVNGSSSTFYDWTDEIQKYIDNPTIDGFVLNHTGKTRFEKLKKERENKVENDRLDIEVKRQTIEGAKFSRNIAYLSLTVAIVTALVPLIIWGADKDKTPKTETQLPELKQLIQTQQQIQQSLQHLQKIIYSADTSVKKIKIED